MLKVLVLSIRCCMIGPSCVRGFQALGHNARFIGLDDDEKTRILKPIELTKLLTEVISYGPDLILDINGHGCDRDGISLYAYKSLGIPLFVWFVDNPLVAMNYENYENYRYPHLFIKLVFDRFLSKEMERLGISGTYHLPLGTDINYFRPLAFGSPGPDNYKTDISFVGRLYNDRNSIFRKKLNEWWPDMPEVVNDAIGYAVRLLAEGEKGATSQVIHKAYKHLGIKPEYPRDGIEWMINIIVENESARDFRVEMVRPLLKYGIEVYGDKSWSELLKDCRPHPQVPYIEELPKVYNSTAINLNISRTQLRSAVNQRVFDVPACKAFLLTDYAEELEEYFIIGKEVACYKDREDLCRLVSHYLDNPRDRERIAEAGYERVIREHTYADRMRRVIEIYNSINKEEFAGIDERGDSWDKANLCIGEAYLRIGDREKAKYYFQRGLNPCSGSYIRHLNSVGISLLRNRGYSDCIPVFKEASVLDPHEPSFLTNIGLAYEHLGQYVEAGSFYTKALEADPKYEPALNNLRSLYQKQATMSPHPQPSLIKGEGVEKPMLSLCMIVRDEDENLPRCLNSIYKVIDEMVIVDTGSRDRTVDVAEEYGAKVIQHKWDDNFSEARNTSLEMATGEWILILDADEVIAERDLDALKKLCLSTGYDAYSFTTRNYTDESSGAIWAPNDNSYKEGEGFSGWFPSRKTRLFRNDKRIRFTGVVHELVDPLIKQYQLRIGESNIPVHHYGATKIGVGADNKKAKYLEWGRKKIEMETENPKAFYEYGVQCSENGLHEEAVRAFKKTLGMDPEFPYVEGLLGASLIALGWYEDAILYLRKGISKEPQNPGLYNNLASAYYEMGEHDKAIDLYKKAISIHQGYASAYKNMGMAYFRRGDVEQALDSFQKALSLNPTMEDVRRLVSSLSPLGRGLG